MERIITRDEFVAFARERGVRPDWHEPDEQGLTARVEGRPLNFDNAGFWPDEVGVWGRDSVIELHVIFSDLEIDDLGERRRGRDLAAVNLADLCAWASAPMPDLDEIAKRVEVKAREAVSASYRAGMSAMAEAIQQGLRNR